MVARIDLPVEPAWMIGWLDEDDSYGGWSMKKLMWIPLIALTCFSAVGFAQKRAMTFEDMFTMKRASSAKISPDGTSALFRVSQANVDENSYTARIYMVDLKTKDVKPVAPVGSGSPVWRPDGKAFFFTMGGQIYEKALDGSEPRQITHRETGAGGPVVSADGKMLLFAGSVKVIEDQDHSGKVLDDLYFRQWNRWIDGERSHVFVVEASAEKAEGRDITPGDDNVPPISLGSGRDYTFSPDGKEAVIVKNTDEMVAASTNHDLFTVDLASGEMTRLTTNKAWDAEPVYSPDGRYIAYAAMDRAGFEADRHELVIYDRKNKTHRHLDHQPDQP
jgi:Tol biopolymer transport system component